MITKLTLIMIVILLLPITTYALAIAPGQAETEFYPNEQKTYDFELINNEDRTINVVMSAGGELANFVDFQEKTFSMKPRESKRIRFSVNFPKEINLPNTVFITATTPISQIQQSGTLNAYVALEFKLLIKGEHKIQKEVLMKTTSLVTGQASGFSDIEIVDTQFENLNKETAKLEIDIRNTGTTETEVFAEVRFGKGINAKSATIAPVKITGGATKKLVTYVDVKGLPAGTYDTEIVLKYADKIKKQLIKLQIIETGTEYKPAYVYVALGLLIAFNLIFILLITKKR